MDTDRIEDAAGTVFAERNDIVAAYLYGSAAEGTEHADSDIDIAVLFEQPPDDLPELDIAQELAAELDTPREIDVRVLNDAGLRFTHQVLKHGTQIYTCDEDAAVEFEEEFYRRYLDMKPLIEEHDRIRMERMTA